jgi:hypothetical protein
MPRSQVRADKHFEKNLAGFRNGRASWWRRAEWWVFANERVCVINDNSATLETRPYLVQDTPARVSTSLIDVSAPVLMPPICKTFVKKEFAVGNPFG